MHLIQAVPAALELIVVLDGGKEEDRQVAEEFSALVLSTDTKSGPAQARNLGAQMAQGDLLFFVDADVAVPPNILALVARAFESSPELTAMIGSYDDAPGALNFLSQYKNLLHHYTHQTAQTEVSTFWGACGAIRRDVFLSMGGFDPSYRRPCVEDIELGYRLTQAGFQIRLYPWLQVKHLKRWHIKSLVQADFFDRALPWTTLILQYPQNINNLNLKLSSRLSVVLVYGLLASSVGCRWGASWLGLVGVFSLMLVALNWDVYQFFHRKRGLRFTLKTLLWHWFYYCYGGLAFGIGFIRHHWQRYWAGITIQPHSLPAPQQKGASRPLVQYSPAP